MRGTPVSVCLWLETAGRFAYADAVAASTDWAEPLARHPDTLEEYIGAQHLESTA